MTEHTTERAPESVPESVIDSVPKSAADSVTDSVTDSAAEKRAPGERKRQRRRKLAAYAVLLGVCLGVVVTRAVWQGRSALAEGDVALSNGEHRTAIERWRRAARWYVPLAPHVGDAYDRLEDLGDTAAGQGDIETALACFRGVRSSILATRSLYTPHGHRLDPANRRIAELMARQEALVPDLMAAPGAASPPAPSRDADEPAVGSKAWHYALLSRDDAPSVFWSIIALLGFAMWVSGGLLFALRGVSAKDRLVPRMAAYAGGLIASGLVVWMTGLYLA